MGAAEDQASPKPGYSAVSECPSLADCTPGGLSPRCLRDGVMTTRVLPLNQADANLTIPKNLLSVPGALCTRCVCAPFVEMPRA